jgi:hypothetical protein
MTGTGRIRAWPGVLILLMCFGTGAVALLGAFDVGPVRHADINGPPWIAGVAGGLFLLFGNAIAFAGTTWFRGAQRYLALPIVAGFAAIGNWIAFGEGPRECSGGISFLFVSISGPSSEIECRIAFGIGALILDAALLWFLAAQLRKLVRPERGTRAQR